MGIWEQGYFNSDEVIKWADSQINSLEKPDDELIELSLNGPSKCFKLQPYEFPRTKELSFIESFSLRILKLNLSSDSEINTFINWATSAAMGEDTENKEVMFCYMLDDYLGYNSPGTISYFKENIQELLPACKKRVSSLLNQLNA